MGGNDFDLHAEIGQFLLDQAAGEFQCFDGDRLLRRRRFIQQRQRRQIAVHVDEQRALLFLLDALRFLHFDNLRLDADRRGLDDLGALLHHHFLALDRGDMADLAVFARHVEILESEHDAFQRRAEPLDRGQPGNMEKQAETESKQQQQEQRGAGKTERALGAAADHFAQHAARRAGQRQLDAVHAHVFDAEAAGQHDDKPDQADQGFMPVFRLAFLLQQETLRHAAIAQPQITRA